LKFIGRINNPNGLDFYFHNVATTFLFTRYMKRFNLNFLINYILLNLFIHIICKMCVTIGDPSANAKKTMAIPILILFETLSLFSCD